MLKNSTLKIIRYLFIFYIFINCKEKIDETIPFGNEDFIKTNCIISKIDSIKTNNEIEELVRSIDTTYSKFLLKDFNKFLFRSKHDSLTLSLYEKLNFNHIYLKGDLDNNGYTDLLVIGDNCNCYTGKDKTSCSFTPLVIMNFNGKYKIERINLTQHNKIIPTIEYYNNQAFLSIYRVAQVEYKKFEELKQILTYKFGGFIEYNDNPKQNIIDKLKFKTTSCFGTCPVFELVLRKDSISTFRAIRYNFSDCGFYDIKSKEEQLSEKDEGIFFQKISINKFNEINDLLNYIDFTDLKDYYNVWHTCDQTSELKIKYDKNKFKAISDYGLVGTFGLKLFYDKLFEFRFDENWKEE